MRTEHHLPPATLELLRKQVAEIKQRQLELIDQQDLLNDAVNEICELVGIPLEGGVEFNPETGTITQREEHDNNHSDSDHA
jgi:hypothetical protein